MSLTCEISGESLTSTLEDVVVTPSGHCCLKRLLLAKLAENGGMDPFESFRQIPLSEDQLVTLKKPAKSVPPRPSVTSLPNLLQTMQSEYDALVLELFDTRKALEETRKELSQALYQNDAAVRVVAKLSMERDAARQELEKWNASVGAAPSQPPSKKRKLEDSPMKNNLPEPDLQAMVDTWGTLQPQRKPMLKQAAAAAPTTQDLQEYTKLDHKSWHKSTCKGLLGICQNDDLVVTAGKDKQVVVYNTKTNQVQHNFNFGSVPTSVHSFGDLVVAGDAKGNVKVYSLASGDAIGNLDFEGAIVNTQVHPTGKHVCVATSSGNLVMLLVQDGTVHHISTFESEESTKYSCGALHPDGLIYAAGTSDGKIHMWDFKNKVLASTLQDGDETVQSIVFSNNGYHLATCHDSGCKVWDLRKQKTLATLSAEKCKCAGFDTSGKYLCFTSSDKVQYVPIKEWNSVSTLQDGPANVSGIVWGDRIMTCTEKGRDVNFHGK